MHAEEASIHETVSTVTSSLLGRVRGSEDMAWSQLVEVYSPLVLFWCDRRGLQSQDALDVGQEVWESVYRGISRFRREQSGDTFRGWLRTITENKIRDHWRKRGSVPTESAVTLEPIAPESRSSAETPICAETREVFEQIVQWIATRYKEHNWRAFIKVLAEGQNRDHVAQELGITRNQVDLACSRIRKALQQEFGKVT